MLVDDGISES